MSIELADSLGLQGELSIYIKPVGCPDQFLFFRGKNRITNHARKHLLGLATDVSLSLSPNPITSFKVGTGGTGQTLSGAETDLFIPLDPLGGDPYLGAIAPVSFPDSPLNMVAEFAFEVSASELVGQSLSEVGLFCDNNWNGTPASTDHMFNIKLFPAVTKTSTFALVFNWKVNFSGAC